MADTEDLSVKQESMPGRTREKLHFHTDAQQFIFIIKEVATFYLAAKRKLFRTKRYLPFQPKTKHYIANETDKQIDFLVVYHPSSNKNRATIEQ